MLENRIYTLLCKRARGNEAGRIRTKIALSKLSADVTNDLIEIRKALMVLRTDGKVEYTASPSGEPISAFITVIPPKVEISAYAITWSGVLDASSLSQEDRLALVPVGNALDGFTKSDMERLITGLVRLRNDQAKLYSECNFNVSASYLLGSSKLLSAIDSRALQSFGIAVDRFASRLPYVVIGGNISSPTAVILVENPIPFETAISSAAASQCLFVCTFGFGLSAAANDYGNQLAGIVESGRAAVLNRSSGASTTIDKVLSHSAVHFWGDLDIAGMQIYERLAKHIPSLQLSALYLPMIEAVKTTDHRHSYVTAVGKAGQSIFSAAREDSIVMLSHCYKLAVDQEFVSADQIEALAGKIFTPPA